MNERPKALTDAECRSAMLADICCSQAERIAVLEAALRPFADLADQVAREAITSPSSPRRCREGRRGIDGHCAASGASNRRDLRPVGSTMSTPRSASLTSLRE
jgi:hypothetical protein